jgi:hypothetical protein
MTKRILYILLLFFGALAVPVSLYSQEIEIDKNEERIVKNELRGIIYKQEYQYGFGFSTNGYFLNFRRSYSPSVFKERGLELDVAIVRHPKEVNGYSYIYQGLGSSSFVYGKLNSLYPVRFGYGEKHEIAQKIDVSSVEINYFYYAGVSMGIVKPIYLQINKAPISSFDVELVNERYDPNKHTYNDIYGGTLFTNGFRELTLYPGIYGKFGLDFDYKISTKRIATVETGILVDYYFRKVPIMAFEDNFSYFIAFYASINFGKRWN